ncbi:MAG: MurR/RpiR family transcriptional regulator [Clostridiales bacterium]|nr:MurR/RpiR family transcriptional regulator [Clostridiales bacterium]
MEHKLELMERIRSMEHLSKGQKRISDYILQQYDKAAFMTAAKLGEAVHVSESTIVRFAIALGYDGYPQLQKAIQEMVRNRLTAVQRMEIAPDIKTAEVLSVTLKSDMQNIRNLQDNINPKDFEKAVKTMLTAKRLYILGLRASAPLAAFFGYYLTYIFDDLKVITQGGSEVKEQLARMTEGDVMVGISFPRYSNRTIESMKYAKSLGATTIAITDSVFSPMGQTADICLTANSSMASFVDSLVAPMSLINALLVALGIEKKQELSAFFEKLEIIWNDTAIYTDPNVKQ